MSKLFIYIGFFLIFLGIIFHYFEGYFKWFGNLPGDFKVNQKNFKIFIPFTSMLLISILMSLIISFLKKILK